MNEPTNDVAVPTIFNFQDFEIRTLTDANGEPWFVVRDVCDYLGLEDVHKAILRVPECHLTGIRLRSGGQAREMKAVDEPGLYRLVLRSDKPQAEPFMEWVTADVLPAIRKNGSYAVNNQASAQDRLITAQDEIIRLHRKCEALQDEKIALLEARKKKRVNRPVTEEEKQEIVAMVASGMSQSEVAKKMRRSSATVSYLVSERLRAAGVAPITPDGDDRQLELFPIGVFPGEAA